MRKNIYNIFDFKGQVGFDPKPFKNRNVLVFISFLACNVLLWVRYSGCTAITSNFYAGHANFN